MLVTCPRCGGTGLKPTWEYAANDPRLNPHKRFQHTACFKCRKVTTGLDGKKTVVGTGKIEEKEAINYIESEMKSYKSGRMGAKMKAIGIDENDAKEKLEQRLSFLKKSSDEIKESLEKRGIHVPNLDTPSAPSPPKPPIIKPKTKRSIFPPIKNKPKMGLYAIGIAAVGALIMSENSKIRAADQRSRPAKGQSLPEVSDGSMYYKNGIAFPVDPWVVQNSWANRINHHK